MAHVLSRRSCQIVHRRQLLSVRSTLTSTSAKPLVLACTFATSARRHSDVGKGDGNDSAVQPFNLSKWLSQNSHLLQPPVNNYLVNNSSMTVMIVGGPNARTDYHINQTPEWFFMYRGDMLLKTVSNTSTTPHIFRDIPIREGEMFLLPPNTPHNPVRFANTVGIVLEQPRPKDSIDRLRWYCGSCSEIVHEKSFYCTDLGTQIKEAVQAFELDQNARTCKNCGEICQTRPRETIMP